MDTTVASRLDKIVREIRDVRHYLEGHPDSGQDQKSLYDLEIDAVNILARYDSQKAREESQERMREYWKNYFTKVEVNHVR